jgi:hypothetical protein
MEILVESIWDLLIEVKSLRKSLTATSPPTLSWKRAVKALQ